MNLKLKIFILLILMLEINLHLKAQEVLPDSIVKERIQELQTMLNNGKKAAKVWWYGWLITYGTATIVQSALYFNKNELAYHQDMALGAGTTLLGTIGQFIFPIPEGYSNNILAKMPEGTNDERFIKLKQAENLLEECANWEKDGRSWKTHTLYGTVNLGCGLIVWLGFKRSPLEGAINFAANMAISEVQIYTQPTKAIRDYNNYFTKHKSGDIIIKSFPKMIWSCYAVPGGAGLKLRF